MRYLLISILVICAFLVPTGAHAEEDALNPALHTALAMGAVTCEATYYNWFAVKLVLKREHAWIAGVTIQTGHLFEKTDKVGTRISVETIKLAFKDDGTASEVINAIVMDDGLLKGEFGDKFKPSTLAPSVDNYTRSVCDAVSAKTLTCSGGQVAVWLRNGNPTASDLARWIITPGDSPLFRVDDMISGLMLAETLSVPLATKSMYSDANLMVRGLVKGGAVSEWSRKRLNALGYEGNTLPDIAETIFKREDLGTITIAAMILSEHNRSELLRSYVLDRSKAFQIRQAVSGFLLSSLGWEKSLELFDRTVGQEYRLFAKEWVFHVNRYASDPDKIVYMRKIMDMGLAEDQAVVGVQEIRKLALKTIMFSKQPEAVDHLLHFMEHDPVLDIQRSCTTNLVSRKEPRALPVLERMVANENDEGRKKWYAKMLDELRKNLAK